MSFTYPFVRSMVDGQWNLASPSLARAVAVALPSVSVSVDCHETDVKVNTDPELTASEQTTLDGVVAAEKAAADPLAELKARRVADIREHTDQLIAQGAVYGGVTYMSTESGRFDVLGIFTVGVVAATPGFFPEKVTSTDGTTETEFADAAAFVPFFTQMMGTYKHWKNTGQVLRAEVNAATTEAEVNAVVDDRTWPWDGS